MTAAAVHTALLITIGAAVVVMVVGIVLAWRSK